MPNAITEERLQDILQSDRWREHIAILSETLGFSLTVLSDAGIPLVSVPASYSFCKPLHAVTAFRSRCETTCHATMMDSLKKSEPVFFKCAARVMSFSLPIEYFGERAVIVGQGSFSSYDDFRAYMELIKKYDLETPLTVTAPLRFTSVQDAHKACLLVDRSVSQLLKNAQENVSLRKKVAGLKEMVGRWGAAGDQDAASVYEHLLQSLVAVLDIHHVTVFSWDRQRGVYASVYGRRKDGGEAETFFISDEDPIVRDLLEKKPYVLSAEPVPDRRTDLPQGMGSLYFFPLWIRGNLESILAVGDGVLRESDINIVTSFCRQAALAIENNRLHSDLFRKFDRFAAIADLTKEITPIRNYETLLRSILDMSAELLKAEQGSLMLLDHETDALLLEAKKGEYDISETLRIQKGEGIAGKVAAVGEPLLVENLEDDPRVRQKNRQHYKTRSFVSVPLKIGDRTFGVLNLADKSTGEVFNQEDLKLIQSFTAHAAVVLERNALYSQTEKLKKLSITDPLTGLLNRRYLHERLEEEVARSQRHSRQVGILMLDIDGFKLYNDTFGHLAGDKALKLIAEALIKSVRSMDVLSRYGGDEFMVVLPETDTALAVHIAERIRCDVAKIELPPRGGTEQASNAVTVSIGIASYPDHGEGIDLLLERVDQALYRAKAKGRNRIEVFA